MRTPSQISRLRRTGRVVLAVLLAIALLFWIDWRSIERGNRLFREGMESTAGEVYRNVVEGGRRPEVARFNLGTALLDEDPQEADNQLQQASASRDTTVARRGSYNLGYARLTRVDASLSPDSALTLLQGSVAASRAALRFDVDDPDARWNLALAQRMIDSLTFNYRLQDREQLSGQDETRLEDQALTRSNEGVGESGLEPEDPPPSQSFGERRGAALGAREAWASQDPGPINDESARQLISNLDDDPEQLVRGLLWAHRPDVEWWNAEPYPGGDW
ncbi:MAG: hypothetical protein GEU90_08920 [Gemmatimonas sp.]|nr:hypothetical protein [Gemmatimonas sp.]